MLGLIFTVICLKLGVNTFTVAIVSTRAGYLRLFWKIAFSTTEGSTVNEIFVGNEFTIFKLNDVWNYFNDRNENKTHRLIDNFLYCQRSR